MQIPKFASELVLWIQWHAFPAEIFFLQNTAPEPQYFLKPVELFRA